MGNSKLKYEDSLAAKRPDLASEWCDEMNEGLSPADVSPGMNLAVYWKCKHSAHPPWKAKIFRRTYGQKCPLCRRIPPYEKSLASVRPDLADEWHTVLNDSVTPSEVYVNSNDYYWWKCNDPNHEPWRATVEKRNNGRGCPYCSGTKVSNQYNFAVLCPELLKEWDFDRNIGIDPHLVHPSSGRKVWWRCSVDPSHGSWEAVVASRATGVGCPRCNKKIITEDNSLAAVFPQLAMEWHPTLNGERPEQVFAHSSKKAWWLCQKDFTHAPYQATVNNRVEGDGCPYCSGHKLSDTNRLSLVRPDLVLEWHPTKNGTLTPDDVSFGTHEKVWWICSRNPTHEWQASVANRSKGRGCPHCKQSSLEVRLYTEIKTIFPDVLLRERVNQKECDIFIPSIGFAVEIDGYAWHIKRRQKDKEKNVALAQTGIFLIRIRDTGLPLIGELDIEYDIDTKTEKSDLVLVKKILALVVDRCKDAQKNELIREYLMREQLLNNDEYMTILRIPVFPGRSLREVMPEVAKEWHETKNGQLGPEHVTCGNNKKVWWRCSVNKSHVWQALIANRAKGHGCPFCAGQRATLDNNLARVRPELLNEWSYLLNEIQPEDVAPYSGKKVWWKCADPKHPAWLARVSSRTIGGNGCPYCSGHKICESNSLAAVDPEIASEWHPTLNGDKTPADVTPNSSFYAWWQCRTNPNHSWYSKVGNRHIFRGKCPQCKEEARK